MKIAPALAVALSLVLTAFTAPAHADGSITFIKDREVWIASPDGSGARQVSHDATARSAMRNPSQRNDGVIYAAGPDRFFYRYNADGTSAGAPLQAPTCGGLGYGPTSAQVRPRGGLILYNYIYSDCFAPFDELHVRTTVVSDNTPVLSESVFPHWKNVGTPRWIGDSTIAMIGLAGDDIFLQPEFPAEGGQAPGLKGWISWEQPGQDDFNSLDYHAASRNVLLEVTPNGVAPQNGPPEDADLIVVNAEAAEGSAVTPVCALDNFAKAPATPRWSPDGTQIVWTGGDGVYVSPAPVSDAGGNCVLHPKLIAAGGSDASWGGTGALGGDTTPPGGGGTTPPGGGTTPPGGTGDDKPPAGDTQAPAVKLTARGAKIGTTLGKGYTATVSCDEACSVNGQLTFAGRLGRIVPAAKVTRVASGSARLTKAGTAKLKLKFTKKAKKALKRKRSVKLTLQVTVKDAAGNPSTRTARVTLKR